LDAGIRSLQGFAVFVVLVMTISRDWHTKICTLSATIPVLIAFTSIRVVIILPTLLLVNVSLVVAEIAAPTTSKSVLISPSVLLAIASP
jgi:hypothetical protein